MENIDHSIDLRKNLKNKKNLEKKESFNMKNAKKQITALLIDIFLWAYTFLVLYKIVYQKLILALRYPEFSWQQPLYALAAGVLMTILLFGVQNMSLGKAANGLYPDDPDRSWVSRPYAFFLYFLIALTFFAGLFISQVSLREFFSEQGMAGARRIFTALLTPNWGLLQEGLFAAIETIYMAFIATVIALPVAFIMSFFAARNLMIHGRLFFAIYNLTRFYLNMTRSIEPLIWAIIFSVWVGIGPFAGMLALCLHSVASLAKLYSEQIENINDGPVEAMTATGAHPIQVIWFGVVPQILLPFLSFTIYRWDINVRMATVIGLVGGGGIGTMLMQYQGLGKWNEVGLLVIIIAFIVWVMDYTSAKLREFMK